MRKIKFLTAMALLVFIFSGCGGSADSSSEEESESALHTEITELLTGTWALDSTSIFTSNANTIINGTATSIYLGDAHDLKMVFSDIAFANNADDASGTGSIYYSLISDAYESYRGGNSVGNLIHKSYTSGATTKTQSMVLNRTSDTEWTLQSSGISIRMKFSSLSSGKMTIQITGTGELSALETQCNYTIECTLAKISAGTEIEDSDTEDETDTNISAILEGTWLFATGTDSSATESATATNDTDGTDIDLKLASSVTLKIASIDLEPDDNTTSLTGTVKVDYAQKWTAYILDVKQGTDGAFAFSKTNTTMKIIKIKDGIWRIEDTTNSNENIIITINSSTEIQTVWTGSTTATLGGNIDSYTYNITCVFRKQ